MLLNEKKAEKSDSIISSNEMLSALTFWIKDKTLLVLLGHILGETIGLTL